MAIQRNILKLLYDNAKDLFTYDNLTLEDLFDKIL